MGERKYMSGALVSSVCAKAFGHQPSQALRKPWAPIGVPVNCEMKAPKELMSEAASVASRNQPQERALRSV